MDVIVIPNPRPKSRITPLADLPEAKGRSAAPDAVQMAPRKIDHRKDPRDSNAPLVPPTKKRPSNNPTCES